MEKEEFQRPFANNIFKLGEFVHKFYLFEKWKQLTCSKLPFFIAEIMTEKNLLRKLWNPRDHIPAILNANTSFHSSFTLYFTKSKSNFARIFFCTKFSFSFVFPHGMFSSPSMYLVCTTQYMSIITLFLLSTLYSFTVSKSLQRALNWESFRTSV